MEFSTGVATRYGQANETTQNPLGIKGYDRLRETVIDVTVILSRFVCSSSRFCVCVIEFLIELNE